MSKNNITIATLIIMFILTTILFGRIVYEDRKYMEEYNKREAVRNAKPFPKVGQCISNGAKKWQGGGRYRIIDEGVGEYLVESIDSEKSRDVMDRSYARTRYNIVDCKTGE